MGFLRGFCFCCTIHALIIQKCYETRRICNNHVDMSHSSFYSYSKSKRCKRETLYLCRSILMNANTQLIITIIINFDLLYTHTHERARAYIRVPDAIASCNVPYVYFINAASTVNRLDFGIHLDRNGSAIDLYLPNAHASTFAKTTLYYLWHIHVCIVCVCALSRVCVCLRTISQ